MKKYLVILLSLLLAVLFLFVIGCKKVEEPAEAPTSQAPEKSSEVKETDYYFHKAHQLFLKKDLKAAASDIRKGVELLNKETESATEEGKKALTSSINELGQLSKDVENGTVTSDKKIKDVFIRAEHALANHHYLKASEQWAKKESKDTGYEMKKAAQHLGQTVKWAGHKMETGTLNVIKEARVVAGKLIEGAGWGT
jgi:hypothetical protein